MGFIAGLSTLCLGGALCGVAVVPVAIVVLVVDSGMLRGFEAAEEGSVTPAAMYVVLEMNATSQ